MHLSFPTSNPQKVVGKKGSISQSRLAVILGTRLLASAAPDEAWATTVQKSNGLPLPETHWMADLLCPDQLKAQQQHVRLFCIHLQIHVQNPKIVALGKGSDRVLCFCGNALTAHESPVWLTPARGPHFHLGSGQGPRRSQDSAPGCTPSPAQDAPETLPRSCSRSLRAVVS